MSILIQSRRWLTLFTLLASVATFSVPILTSAAHQPHRTSGTGGQIDMHAQDVPPVMESNEYFVDAHAHPISGEILLQVMAKNHVGYGIVSYPGDRAKQDQLNEFCMRYPQMVPIRWWDPRTDRPADIEFDLKVHEVSSADNWNADFRPKKFSVYRIGAKVSCADCCPCGNRRCFAAFPFN